ncbi:MAG: thiamine phosphate synthase [Mariprofundaceae bacterium]|nr:thiamine phosphate synthase [Mariprofundaceae bacterium]
MGHSTLLNSRLPRLLFITEHARCGGDVFFHRLEAALKGGVDTVLVREKQMDSARLLAFCARLRELTGAHDARLIVHTQADIAAAVDADGVHVAANDIPRIAALRTWLDAPEMCMSASCHDAGELNAAAAAGVDFALLSPVFPTASHPGAAHIGVARFRDLAAQSPLPVVALGGIDVQNRGELAGFSVAVISAILDATDAQKAAVDLLAE